MKSEKGQSLVMVGVALFLLAGLCLYLGLSQPKISSGVLVETPTTAVQSGATTGSAAATVGRSAGAVFCSATVFTGTAFNRRTSFCVPETAVSCRASTAPARPPLTVNKPPK